MTPGFFCLRGVGSCEGAEWQEDTKRYEQNLGARCSGEKRSRFRREPVSSLHLRKANHQRRGFTPLGRFSFIEIARITSPRAMLSTVSIPAITLPNTV